VTSTSLSNSFSGVLAASYEIDLWGRNRDLITAAKADSDTSLYAREVIRLSTRAGVANAWFALAAARERLMIAQENVTNATRIASVVKQRLAVGTGSALDVAQQESLIASQRAALPDLRQSAEANRLALLMGRVPEGLGIATPRLGAIKVPGISPGLPSQLLLRRPDIRQAEAQLEAAKANLSAARKALLPAISLSGQGGQRSAALSNLLRPESAIWSLAAGLTAPIFDGGRLNAQADLAEAQKREVLELYRKSIVSALVDVENALVAVRESAAREAALSVVVSRSREAFKLSEERLRAGTIDLTTLLNTQATLFNAQDSLVQARLNRLNAAVSLFQALGGDFTVEVPAPLAAQITAQEDNTP
jgi:outer membrane protein, multidrug efflux system